MSSKQTPGHEIDAGDSLLVRLFGRPSRVKIIEALLTRYTAKLTATQIAEVAGIDKSTFHRNKDLLLELEIIERSDIGGNTVFTLNENSPLVQALGQLHTEISLYTNELVTSKTQTTTPDKVFEASSDDEEEEKWVPENLLEQNVP